MDWVHCNSCFSQPSKGALMYFTSCGHIYCHGCVEKGGFDLIQNEGNALHCQICAKSSKAVKIDRAMNKHALNFFRPLLQHIDELQSLMQRIKQVAAFQDHQRGRLQKHRLEQIRKQQQHILQQQSFERIKNSSSLASTHSSFNSTRQTPSNVSLSVPSINAFRNLNSFNHHQVFQGTLSAPKPIYSPSVIGDSFSFTSDQSFERIKPKILASYSASSGASGRSSFCPLVRGRGYVGKGPVAPRVLNPK